MKPRLAIFTDYYAPEDVSTGYFLTGIAEGLANEFDCTVFCGFPSDPDLAQSVTDEDVVNGVRVRRVRALGRKDGSLPMRFLRAASFGTAMALRALRHVRRGDIAMAVTNPPLLPYNIWPSARLKHAKFVLLVHDVYPEILVATGLMRSRTLAVRALDSMSRFICRRSDRIIVLGRDMAKIMAQKCGSRADISVIPHWGDIEDVRPGRRQSNGVLRRLGLQDKFVIQHSGNIGRTHDIATVLDAAKLLRSHGDIHFLISGWGHGFDRAQATAGAPANVTFLGRQSRDNLSELLNAADVLLMSFRPGMSGLSVPSRLYNMLASGKALIAAVDPDSEVASMIDEEDIGWTVTPGDARQLADTIIAAKQRPAMVSEFGRRARIAAESRYARDHAVAAYKRALRLVMECGRQ